MSTNCASPPELDDKQLLAYLDDREADQAIMLHLKNCPYCREKAEALNRLQKRLTKKLYRVNCPSPLELGEYHLRMLSATQMLIVRQHLTTCPHCAREVAQLDEFLSDLEPNREGSLAQTGKVLVARLLGGNQTLVVAALRGERKGPLTFEADGILITLDFQRGTEGRVSVMGQVAADNQDRWTGASVKIEQEGALPITLILDDLGAFQSQVAYPGSIDIAITSPDGAEIQIPGIAIDI